MRWPTAESRRWTATASSTPASLCGRCTRPSLLELFETTIVAHLGTAGPMGAIAEQQLRILAGPFL
ncbi:hypothetical protein [Kitasatospora griseola]|uniref:hypothetical protein n=1 Tax=Kitasatospora griseola TaxID=2064 RepID=UPI00166FC000|nr:hypothetical protein [Kitasatospora griseola]